MAASFNKIYSKMCKMAFLLGRKALPRRGFILKTTERPYVPLKIGIRDF